MTRTLADGNLTPRKPGTDLRPEAGEAWSSRGKPAPCPPRGGAGRLPGTAAVLRKVSRPRGYRDLSRQQDSESWSSLQERECGEGRRPPHAASPPSLFQMEFKW